MTPGEHDIATRLGALDSCLRGLCTDITHVKQRLDDLIRVESRVDEQEKTQQRLADQICHLDRRQRKAEQQVASLQSEVRQATVAVPGLLSGVADNSAAARWMRAILLMIAGALLGLGFSSFSPLGG